MDGLLSPKVDFVFKKIFGNEQHPEILISFLNAVIKSEDPIKSVELKNTDIDKDYSEAKFLRLDIKAVTDRDEQINIEIQVRNEYNMIQRSLYYWSRMYDSQLTEKGKYSSLKRTVCINVLDFNYLPNDRFHNVYRLKEVSTNEELTDTMELHFIEIPKLGDIVNVDKVDMLEAWVSFIKNPNSMETRHFENNNEQIKDAMTELVRLSSDSKERLLYEKRLESMIELNSSMESGFNKGIKEGIEKGSLQASLNIAKELLKIGTDIEVICSVTKLSKVEIEKLKNNI